jgi:multidrug efflux pump subunit AcrA (membrane-fusion protein)
MEREARLAAEEAELNRRRSELGAVELKREAVEQRERALAAREEELEAAAAKREAVEEPSRPETRGPLPAGVTLLFVPGPAYRLVEVERRQLDVGAPLELDGESYVVARLGKAPLPGDDRRCAYLERGGPGLSASGGSS